MSALRELSSAETLKSLLQSERHVLICASATWCGPCTRFKPLYEQFAAMNTGRVVCGIIYEHVDGAKEWCGEAGVRGFPTFMLFVGGAEADRTVGGDLARLEALVKEHCAAPAGGGDVRALRLARLGAAPPAAAALADDAVMTEDGAPAVVDPAVLDALVDMGVEKERAAQVLAQCRVKSVAGAMEWMANHPEDEGMDESGAVCRSVDDVQESSAVCQSYKCNQCGVTLSSMANLELHANKTGHSDFEESTDAAKVLTDEERAAKVERLKQILKQKRMEREEEEKKANVNREKGRRTMGQEMAKTQEVMKVDKQKHDSYMRKKKKDDDKREKQRILAEIAKDKRDRAANGGRLKGKLGVEGYNPDGIQYDLGGDTAAEAAPAVPGGTAAPAETVSTPASALKKVDDCLAKISSYRAGGDGGKCLKILLAYVRNVVDKPTEEKFRAINTENAAYKSKVKPFVGAKSLLLAVGFAPDEDGGKKLLLREDADREVLAQTKERLKEAFAKY